MEIYQRLLYYKRPWYGLFSSGGSLPYVSLIRPVSRFLGCGASTANNQSASRGVHELTKHEYIPGQGRTANTLTLKAMILYSWTHIVETKTLCVYIYATKVFARRLHIRSVVGPDGRALSAG
jgi:hypothetical protein